MEESLNRNYVNISNKPFVHHVYNTPDEKRFSYKPTSAFWLSLESDKEEYHSEWDRKYGEFLKTDEDGNLYATTVKFKPTTYIMSPAIDETILEGFKNFTEGKNLTPEQRRKLLVELVKSHTNNPDIENVICQIDLEEDISVMEKIFCGFKLGEEHPDAVYENLASNMKKAFRQNFAGVEVTAFALGLDKNCPGEGIDDIQIYWSSLDPKYEENIGDFEIPSVAIFDTSCLDIVKELIYPPAPINEKDGDDREDY